MVPKPSAHRRYTRELYKSDTRGSTHHSRGKSLQQNRKEQRELLGLSHKEAISHL